MIRFMIRQMTFEQRKTFINLIDQTRVDGKLMNVADSAMGRTLMAPIDVVVNIPAGHHRFGLLGPISFMSTLSDFSLAFCQFFSDISFHSKCPFRISYFSLAKL